MKNSLECFLSGDFSILTPVVYPQYKDSVSEKDLAAVGYQFSWGQMLETRQDGLLVWDIRLDGICGESIQAGIHHDFIENLFVSGLEHLYDTDPMWPENLHYKGKGCVTPYETTCGGLVLDDLEYETVTRAFVGHSFISKSICDILVSIAQKINLDSGINLLTWGTPQLLHPKTPQDQRGYAFKWGKIVESSTFDNISWKFYLSQIYDWASSHNYYSSRQEFLSMVLRAQRAGKVPSIFTFSIPDEDSSLINITVNRLNEIKARNFLSKVILPSYLGKAIFYICSGAQIQDAGLDVRAA